MTKRQKLKLACAIANVTIADFAHMVNVSDVAVHRTLNGHASERLNKEIDRFIAEQFAKLPNLNQGGGGRKRAA